MKRVSVLAVVAVCVGVLQLATGCGWIAGEAAADFHRWKKVGAYVYDDDLPKLWSELDQLWNEYDCDLPDSPKLDHTFECRARWLRVTKKDAGHAVKIEEEFTSHDDKVKRRRDREIEWKLLERLHPDVAAEIDDDAEKKKAKVRKAVNSLREAVED